MSRTTYYRSIVKDAYSTRDPAQNRVEIMAWKVKEEGYIPPSEGTEGVEDPIKNALGNLRYDKILEDAIEEIGADELSRRTGLKSYRDEQGGRAASTIRGYQYESDWVPPKDKGGYESSHPIKRVLRRYARSQDKGHFEDDEATDQQPATEGHPGRYYGGKIDMEDLKAAYRLARSICSQEGLVFVDRHGDAEAVEDNERIDRDEIRSHDRPIGETKAAVQVEKADGYTAEYWIDLDNKKLVRDDDLSTPVRW
jgi:hypothetical protein